MSCSCAITASNVSSDYILTHLQHYCIPVERTALPGPVFRDSRKCPFPPPAARVNVTPRQRSPSVHQLVTTWKQSTGGRKSAEQRGWQNGCPPPQDCKSRAAVPPATADLQ